MSTKFQPLTKIIALKVTYGLGQVFSNIQLVLVNLNRTLLFESFQTSLATYRHC